MKVETVSAMGIIVEDQRQRRAATLFQNVSYVIEAHLEVLGRRFEKDDPKFSEKDCSGKHRDIFKRPARKGQALLPAFGKSSPERAAPPLFVPHLEKTSSSSTLGQLLSYSL